MSVDTERMEKLKKAIVSVPDFPEEGIMFRDTLPLFSNVALLNCAVSLFVDHIKECFGTVDIIVGLEAKGFLYAPLVAERLDCRFVPVRRKGKLPGKTVQHSYKYDGSDTENFIEIQEGAIGKGERVIIVDDFIMSGVYAAGAEQLVTMAGGTMLEVLFLCENIELKGKDRLSSPFHSFLKY